REGQRDSGEHRKRASRRWVVLREIFDFEQNRGLDAIESSIKRDVAFTKEPAGSASRPTKRYRQISARLKRLCATFNDHAQ
ncbi:MAG TPA: hypothetical protein VN743_12475, partial [Blastocatellia bacterium]|nr:hypothetical protein [Blastocatellia bacterium]